MSYKTEIKELGLIDGKRWFSYRVTHAKSGILWLSGKRTGTISGVKTYVKETIKKRLGSVHVVDLDMGTGCGTYNGRVRGKGVKFINKKNGG